MKIEIYSDVACPWCYIGKKRLLRALLQSGVQAQLEWRPFQLQPGLPPEGLPWQSFMSQKFGGESAMQQAFAQVARAGLLENISFNFAGVARAISTAQLHRLLLWAQGFGLQWPLAEAFFAAHFVHGQNLNDPAQMLDVVASVGLDPHQAQLFLATSDYEAEVMQSQQLAARLGIGGVPFFVFQGKYGLSGAQPVEVFLQAIERVKQESVSN